MGEEIYVIHTGFRYPAYLKEYYELPVNYKSEKEVEGR